MRLFYLVEAVNAAAPNHPIKYTPSGVWILEPGERMHVFYDPDFPARYEWIKEQADHMTTHGGTDRDSLEYIRDTTSFYTAKHGDVVETYFYNSVEECALALAAEFNIALTIPGSR